MTSIFFTALYSQMARIQKCFCIRNGWKLVRRSCKERRGERTEGKKGGEGRKLEDYKNPQVLLTHHWRKKGEGQRRERKEEGKWKRRKRREGEKIANCTDFPQYGLRARALVQAS